MFMSFNARAAPSNEDEAATGAAAIIVLAQKCTPNSIGHFEHEAQGHLIHMLQRYPENIKLRILDDLKMKVKALRLSSSSDSCQSAARLQAMANTWGYAHILQSMAMR